MKHPYFEFISKSKKIAFFSILFFGTLMSLKAQYVSGHKSEFIRPNFLSIVLGRPTDTSITASVLFDSTEDYYLEWGTASNSYPYQTVTYTNTVNVPDEVYMTNLVADTKYYYRLAHRPHGGGGFITTPEYTFHTQRSVNSTFVFDVEADEHLYDYGNSNLYKVTSQNEASANPDFLISLGDIYGDDHTPTTSTSGQIDSLRLYYRSLLGNICNSVPFYFANGNHDCEKDKWLNDGPPNSIGVWSTIWRNYYYPNPAPNGFYTGNDSVEGFSMGLPHDYYAWTWGNAQFIVLDEYRYDNYIGDTTAKPTDWEWTLGRKQYDWLQTTLQNSTSKFKFVFSHHIRGEDRGGAICAPLFEWGGYEDTTLSSYTFPTNRPGWPMPIEDLFKKYGVQIYFQGHDHLFAHEVYDSVIIQEVPMAADSTYIKGITANGAAYTADTLNGSGHIRVTVNSSCVTVQYISSYLPKDTSTNNQHNNAVRFSYTIGNCASAVPTIQTIDEQIIVYPDPASQYVKVRLPDNFKYNYITLKNTMGQTILQTKLNTIDVSEIPNGIYFITVTTENNTYNKKVVINH